LPAVVPAKERIGQNAAVEHPRKQDSRKNADEKPWEKGEPTERKLLSPGYQQETRVQNKKGGEVKKCRKTDCKNVWVRETEAKKKSSGGDESGAEEGTPWRGT